MEPAAKVYRLHVYLHGYLRRRKYGLPKGAPFVKFIHSFEDTKEGRTAAEKYCNILIATTGYWAIAMWGDDSWAKAGLHAKEAFYHRWFFN